MSNRPGNKAAADKKKVRVFTEDSSTRTRKDPDQPGGLTLKKTLYLVLAIVSLIIGIHRCFVDMQTVSISAAIGYNYWIFMITILSLMLLRYDKKKQKS
jgi:hypothetical protein